MTVYSEPHVEIMPCQCCMQSSDLDKVPTHLMSEEYCYMMIDHRYMTKKLLIVILSTNTATKEKERKAMYKKIDKKYYFLCFSFSHDSNLYHQGILH